MDWHIIQGKLNQSEDTRNIQIERQLGVGGFATVYDIGGGEVLKVIDCNYMAKKANIVEKEEPQFFEKLLREVRINDDLRANANSPYLLIANSCFMLENMTGSGRSEEFICLKMMKMAGIFREYADMVPFSEEIVVNVARDIARAMKAYNSSKVKLVHRDISPTNIFVNMDKSSEARFVLGDFGIAKPIIKGNKSVSSVTGLGNKEYASPEQLQGEQLDIRSDIYSLGIVLSQYVTEKGALQIKNGKGCISEEVARIIEKMTRKNIEERYRSVEDLLLDIEEYSMIKQQEKDEIEKLPEQYKAIVEKYEVLSEQYEQLNIEKNNLKGQIAKLEKNKNATGQSNENNIYENSQIIVSNAKVKNLKKNKLVNLPIQNPQKVIDEYISRNGNIFDFIIDDENHIRISKYRDSEARTSIQIPNFVYGFTCDLKLREGAFIEAGNLKEIKLGLGVCDLSHMFYKSNIESLDLSEWDVSNVTSMRMMFVSSQLTSIGNIGKWDVSNVIDMSHMFMLSQLTSIGDIGGWDISNVIDMSHMFMLSQLTSIGDIGGWDISNVTSMSFMFSCSKLTSIGDIGSWDVSNVRFMAGMFLCSELISIGDIGKLGCF